MPYKLQKVRGKDLYFVVNKDTGKKFSTAPLTKAKAEAQLKALHIHTGK